MNSIEIILLNFKETRRRSLNVWKGIPIELINFRPDSNAMSILEMIRHILEGEHLFHKIIENRGNLGDYKSPWEGIDYIDIENEILMAKGFRQNFMDMIINLSESDLSTIKIERSEVVQSKSLGDYLNRIVYHESVHTGQLLSYLRAANVERPNIWD